MGLIFYQIGSHRSDSDRADCADAQLPQPAFRLQPEPHGLDVSRNYPAGQPRFSEELAYSSVDGRADAKNELAQDNEREQNQESQHGMGRWVV